MKKIFAIFTVLAVFTLGLVLAGCPDDGNNGGIDDPSNDGSGYIGTWTNADSTMIISNGTWTLQSPGGNYSGTWIRFNNVLNLTDSSHRVFDGKATLTGSVLEVTLQVQGNSGLDTLTWSLTKSDGSTTLKINNQSSKNFTSIEWGGTTLVSSAGSKLMQGSNITKSVSAGQGYIFFTVESNNTTYRTQELITISRGETYNFNFLNSTVCVDTSTNNTVTLGSL